MKKYTLILFLFINISFAQVPHLVKDINSYNTTNSTVDGFPKQFVELNNHFYFLATNSKHGRELWVSDGTKNGTGLFLDLTQGSGNSNIINLKAVNSSLYFLLDNKQIWKSDGTPKGTFMVKELLPNTASYQYSFSDFFEYNNEVYFSYDSPTMGTELWKTNGTELGTQLVKDIIPGLTGSFPVEYTISNGYLFFTIYGSNNEREIWRTDGSSSGTVFISYSQSNNDYLVDFQNEIYFVNIENNNQILKKFNSNSNQVIDVKNLGTVLNSGLYTYSSEFLIKDNKLFFLTKNTNGINLWQSNGTDTGTIIKKNISTSTLLSTGFNKLFAHNDDKFFFSTSNGNISNSKLWVSDGSTIGTYSIKNFDRIDTNTSTYLGNKIYFKANDGINGYEIWESDGTAQGTNLFYETVPGYQSSFHISNSVADNTDKLFKFNNNIFYGANDSLNGFELWNTDGSIGGTKLFKNIFSINQSPLINEMIAIDNKVFFSANNSEANRELWVSNGTKDGTIKLKESFSNQPFSDNIKELTEHNNQLFFISRNNNNAINPSESLWRSDGTISGTILIKDNINYFTNLDDRIYVFNNNLYVNSAEGLLKSDGTPQGTSLLKPNVNAKRYVSSDNILFFVNNNGLWSTDGTTNGTILIKGGTNNFGLSGIINNKLLFSVSTYNSNSELWISDGTINGTFSLNRSFPSIYPCKIFNNELYFFSPSNGLYKTNGTTNGTVLLKDNIVVDQLGGFVIYNNEMYFSASDGINGHELWKSDGTTSGTVLVVDTIPGNNLDSLKHIFVFNNFIYFQTTDLSQNNEYKLYKTQGDTNSTSIVIDNINQLGSFGIEELFEYSNSLYIKSYQNLFKSSGEANGTRKLNTSFNFDLYEHVKTNNNLFFNAYSSNTDPVYQNELWKLSDCSNQNQMVVEASDNISEHFNYQLQQDSLTNCFCDDFNYIICSVTPTGLSPISNEVNTKVWLDDDLDNQYVKRHYEIYPKDFLYNSTGEITLFFSQSDFDKFNLLNPEIRLPKNTSDNNAKENIIIEQFNGHSANGKPESYLFNSTIINPLESNIIWNQESKRWEISFFTYGFGGFFIKSLGLEIQEEDQKIITVYPNPTNSILNINLNGEEKAEIEIFNTEGRVILSKKEILNEEVIDISYLPSNLYFLRIITKNNSYNIKIIKT